MNTYIGEKLSRLVGHKNYIFNLRDNVGYTLLLPASEGNYTLDGLRELGCEIRGTTFRPSDYIESTNIGSLTSITSSLTGRELTKLTQLLAPVVEKKYLGCYYIQVPDHLVNKNISREDESSILAPAIPTSNDIVFEISSKEDYLTSAKPVVDLMLEAFGTPDLRLLMEIKNSGHGDALIIDTFSIEQSRYVLNLLGNKNGVSEVYSSRSAYMLQEDTNSPEFAFMYESYSTSFSGISYKPIIPNRFFVELENFKEILNDYRKSTRADYRSNESREHKAEGTI